MLNEILKKEIESLTHEYRYHIELQEKLFEFQKVLEHQNFEVKTWVSHKLQGFFLVNCEIFYILIQIGLDQRILNFQMISDGLKIDKNISFMPCLKILEQPFEFYEQELERLKL